MTPPLNIAKVAHDVGSAIHSLEKTLIEKPAHKVEQILRTGSLVGLLNCPVDQEGIKTVFKYLNEPDRFYNHIEHHTQRFEHENKTPFSVYFEESILKPLDKYIQNPQVIAFMDSELDEVMKGNSKTGPQHYYDIYDRFVGYSGARLCITYMNINQNPALEKKIESKQS